MKSRGLSLLYRRLELAVEHYKRDVIGYHGFSNIVGYSAEEAERFLAARKIVKDCEVLMDYIYKLDMSLGEGADKDDPIDIDLENATEDFLKTINVVSKEGEN